MYARRKYGFWMTFNWSKKPFIYGFIYATLVAIIFYFTKKYTHIDLSLPWQPVSVLGITVAFYLGFKNNSSYDRTWEARKIWGGIVNSSRSFGVAVVSFIEGENEDAIKKQLIYRHIAWLTALRYQLRLSKPWEHVEDRVHALYTPTICEEYFGNLDAELMHFIPQEELTAYKSKSNIAAQILATQGQVLQDLYNKNYFNDFRHIELFALLKSFYDEQGRSERIKNFPFPRQYASVAVWTTLIFSILMPFGIIDIFQEVRNALFWLAVPFSALLIWIFFLMEKIGDYSENPFEGTYNDIPITSISRSIEIDLREMINDVNIPKPIQEINGFLM
ncbi:MAG: bestrophin family ion channel [Spirosomataceae bacterium]